ncbi:hypothetical protein FACS189419_03560 [Planctomycetales bacterium]|nr:hypothetical protein FACS189419_03560 [Planctomycetales bacterium]
MRYLFAPLFVFLSVVFAAEAEPYTVTIQAEGTNVLSGPGNDFYPTSQLHAGDKIEVHYEKNGYWAIRPPVGNFSWVSAKYVQLGADNLAEVKADGLASLIGSELTGECSTVQIKLKQGEKVLVLDRRETSENPDSPIWYKIVPPSGEFRWVRKQGTANNTKDSAETDIIVQAQYKTYPRSVKQYPVPNSSPKSLPKAESSAEPKVASAKLLGLQLDDAFPQPLDPFHKALFELEKEVQTVMTRPTDDEVFALLIKRGEELYQIAPTDKDIEKAFHLVESLKRTRLVRQELALRSPAALPPLNNTPSNALKPDTIRTATPLTQTSFPASQYDVTGKLGEFDPLPKGHPPYAVVDDKLQIICFVSSGAGLDLEQYIGKTVGINGVLGFYEHPNKPRAKHITAKNITAIK